MSKALSQRLLKGLLMSSVGAGTIGITTYLTNQNKPVELLNDLTLAPKPDIQEDELEPVQPPEQIQITLEDQNGNKNESSDSEDSGEQTKGNPPDTTDDGSQQSKEPQPPSPPEPQSSDSEPSPEESGDSGSVDASATENENDIVEVIKNTMKEMNNGRWGKNHRQLGSIHSIMTNVQKLNNALEAWKRIKSS